MSAKANTVFNIMPMTFILPKEYVGFLENLFEKGVSDVCVYELRKFLESIIRKHIIPNQKKISIQVLYTK